jgi:uncharacterized cupin superfamily protein
MPKIDIKSVPERTGSSYPSPHHVKVEDRIRQRLGDAGGLTDFGVNLLRLKPGVWSSQRHWHTHEEEFVFIVSGEVVLVTDKGEEILRAGDCAAFPKNVADGHQIINRTDKDVLVLEVGTNSVDDVCTYPDIDMKVDAKTGFTHLDGTPYPMREK